MKTTKEMHPSMTGLESCFEEELAQADRKYANPNMAKFDKPSEAKAPRESKESRRMEEMMHLHA